MPYDALFNFGGLGVAVAVLVVFGKAMFDRLNEASRFTEQLSTNAIAAMQEISRESALAARAQTEAVARLCVAIEELRCEVRDGQEALLRELREKRV